MLLSSHQADKVIMKILLNSGLVILSALLGATVHAQEGNSGVSGPADLPVITSDYIRGPGEPQIVISADEEATIYEYRVNGEIREIKVVPRNGPTYYLVPSGEGWRQQSESRIRVPSWVIFRW
jgi:hypothetical protein